MKEHKTCEAGCCLLSELRTKMGEKYLTLGARPGEENALVDEFFHRVEDSAYHFMLLATRDEQKAHIIGDFIIPHLDEIAAQHWLYNGKSSGMDDTETANLIGTALIEMLKSIPDEADVAVQIHNFAANLAHFAKEADFYEFMDCDADEASMAETIKADINSGDTDGYLRWLHEIAAETSDTGIKHEALHLLDQFSNIGRKPAPIADKRTVDTEYRAAAYNRKTEQYDVLFTTHFSALLAKGRCREKAEEYNKYMPEQYDYDVNRIYVDKRRVCIAESYGAWEPVSEEV